MFYVININNNNNKKYVLFDKKKLCQPIIVVGQFTCQSHGLLPSKQAGCLFLCQNKLQPGPEFGDNKTYGYTRLILTILDPLMTSLQYVHEVPM